MKFIVVWTKILEKRSSCSLNPSQRAQHYGDSPNIHRNQQVRLLVQELCQLEGQGSNMSIDDNCATSSDRIQVVLRGLQSISSLHKGCYSRQDTLGRHSCAYIDMYPIFTRAVLLCMAKMQGLFLSRGRSLEAPKMIKIPSIFAKIRVWGYFGYSIPGYSSIKYPKCGYICLYGYSIQLLSD